MVELPELLVEPEVPAGEPFARLIIDRIALDAVVFEGVDRTTLKSGPGHMPGTPLPGQPGNAVISGHRTTYGRPFFDLDLLVVGDEIEVETALGISTYAVREILIVAPTDVWVADNMDGAWLTLTTCHPAVLGRAAADHPGRADRRSQPRVRGSGGGMKRSQKVLLIVIGSVAGLVALFFLFEWAGDLLDSGGAIGG